MTYHIHEEGRDRIVLKVLANHFTPYGHQVSAYITSKFKLRQYACGHTWGHVNETGRDFYYKEFLKLYTWEDGKEEEFMATWNLYCQDLYKKLLHKWRKSSHPPKNVPMTIWTEWLTIWNGEKWKRNSEIARKNRNSEVAGIGTGVTKHTAGSRSIIKHTLQLEMDLKRKVDCWEVFRSKHRHKDETFVDARSQAIDDAMVTKISESETHIEGEETQIPSRDEIDNLYFEVVGGMKKNCIYGLGSQAKVAFPHAVSTSKGKGRTSSPVFEIEELRTENADLRARLIELEKSCVDNKELRVRMVEIEKSNAENTELRARMADFEGTMRAFMSRMILSQSLDPPSAFPDFSSPMVDSDETQPP